MSTKPFNRGLSQQLLDDLREGPSSIILAACIERGLDVRLRDNYVNVYFRGRSVACLRGRRGRPVLLEVHNKYLDGGVIGPRRGRSGEYYCAFDVDAGLAEAYAGNIDGLVDRARAFVGAEEGVEESLLRANGGTSAVFCFDRQVQVPGIRRRLDLMGLRTDGSAMVAIEVKRYPDPRIQDVPSQLHGYLETFDPDDNGLRADVADSYRTVCRQLRELGLPAPDPAMVAEGMPVEGLVVLADNNARSQLLPRAHAQAQGLDRPIWLWEPREAFAIPAKAEWVQMGE